jgi:hypothetical protein
MNHWKTCNIGHFESILCGGRTFSPAAEFFGWFRRKFFKLVGNTVGDVSATEIILNSAERSYH